ncbi:MAG: DUF6494 family protein [Ectothiorhodospiraceae bacterium]|jgi:hypothetical protein
MNEDAFNMSIRKFLKQVGVTSQREIESAVREALEAGRIDDRAELPVKVTLEMPDLGLQHTVDGTVKLE